jgi:hypothetical protein
MRVRTPASAKVVASLFKQQIQLPRRHISLELTVPLVSVELGIPSPKFGLAFGRELANGSFNLLNAHPLNVSPRDLLIQLLSAMQLWPSLKLALLSIPDMEDAVADNKGCRFPRQKPIRRFVIR